MGAKGYSEYILKWNFVNYSKAEMILDLLTHMTAEAGKAIEVMTFWHGAECKRNDDSVCVNKIMKQKTFTSQLWQ